MWGHTHRCQLALKKNQVKNPSMWSRVPEIGSDPPIGSDRDSGRDTVGIILCSSYSRGSYQGRSEAGFIDD